MTAPHPIQRRLCAEDLVRLRRAGEHARTAASQRQGKIDPNPHQIDAVMFALRRIPEGGCILADEVGLGKTIEAGLVMSQLRAEGAKRILVIVPKPLLGQWQDELRSLFAIESVEVKASPEALAGEGVFVAGREFAGSEKGVALLSSGGRFDLCVIDEAHEVFAGIHKRFDSSGELKQDGASAQTAGRVKELLDTTHTPVILLTATPIQNSLTELWGLVQYVEPTHTLLGDLRTFRDLFCDKDDRKLLAGQEHELRRRLAVVCQRTLRRQAQDFLEKPFTKRRCLLFRYAMTADEKALYHDVSEYLLDPSICAFAGSHRRLLLIGFHRRMASSVRALAQSLEKVTARLLRMLKNGGALEGDGTDEALDFARDLEDGDLEDEAALESGSASAKQPPFDPVRAKAELARVEEFVARARALPGDSKFRSLVEAVRFLEERAKARVTSGKLVIFTESLATQDYLSDELVRTGIRPEEITLFRGVNELPRAREALARWNEEIGRDIPRYRRPSPAVAQRLALVHEFRTRSRIFISTEAGAKGLNLQFCDVVVNYDLPWNPQRIEQRIGRCHRYGQGWDVTVVNFLAPENEAQQLTFELLSRKLELFGKVHDASDAVLTDLSPEGPNVGDPAEAVVSPLSVEFETKLRRIHEQARTPEEIVAEIRAFRDSVEARREEIEAQKRRVGGIIESKLDPDVRQYFHKLREELPRALATFDQTIDRLVSGYFQAIGARHERVPGKGRTTFVVEPSPRLPPLLEAGGRFAVGNPKSFEGADPLHPRHPLVLAAIEEARAAPSIACVRVRLLPDAPGALKSRQGRRGRLLVAKVRYGGLEPVERLLPIVVLEREPAPLPLDQAMALLAQPLEDAPSPTPPINVDASALEDALDEAVFQDQAEVDAQEEGRFDQALSQLEQFAQDRLRLRARVRTKLVKRRDTLRDERAVASADSRARIEREIAGVEEDLEEVEAKIARLEERQDPEYVTWRDRLHERRYAPTQRTIIAQAELVIS